MKKRIMIGVALAAMTMGGGTAAFADYGGGDCGKHETSARPGEFYRRMAKALKLTEAQQSEVKSIFSAERAASQPLQEKLEEKRKLLMQAGEGTSFDEASVRSIVMSMADLRTELAVIHVRTRTQINNVLTPEQRELAKNLKGDKKQRPRHKRVGI